MVVQFYTKINMTLFRQVRAFSIYIKLNNKSLRVATATTILI